MAEEEEGWPIAEVVIGGSKYCDSMELIVVSMMMITGGRMDGWMKRMGYKYGYAVRGAAGIRGTGGATDAGAGCGCGACGSPRKGRDEIR